MFAYLFINIKIDVCMDVRCGVLNSGTDISQFSDYSRGSDPRKFGSNKTDG